MRKKSFLYWTLFLYFSILPLAGSDGRGNHSSQITIHIDPRIELLSTIFRLAQNREYRPGQFPVYDRKVSAHFGRFKKHEAVKAARLLRAWRGISYNAPMSLAIHISKGFEDRVPLDPLPPGIDHRWDSKSAREFLIKVRKFAADSKFDIFFTQNSPLYKRTEQRLRDHLNNYKIVQWCQRFFATASGAEFIIVPGMQNGGRCYGVHVDKAKEKNEIYCILGIWSTDKEGFPIFDKLVLPIVVHEFCHSFINPLVDKHQRELSTSGKKIFKKVEAKMQKQAYTHWTHMMYESLVRASVIRFLTTIFKERELDAHILSEENNGFLWIRKLAQLLDRYENNRKKYPTFEHFFPEIVTFFSHYADR